jgi:hypothetical protein
MKPGSIKKLNLCIKVCMQLAFNTYVSGRKKHSCGINACDIHVAAYWYMDNANSLPTPSERYFALAWCSESTGIIQLSIRIVNYSVDLLAN